ncbi:MAG: Uma2 family endonuclease [Cyanobacteria bacterium J06631_2]
MFTDLLNLPLDSTRLTRQDQILTLSGMTWNDYEKLTQANSSYLLSYLEGVITIVSPSRNHEVIERTISILINAYCRQYNLLYFPLGSTTLKNPETVGKEPDTSYAFDSSKDVPDLAVEVVFSSGGTADLIKYQYLRVGEVWFWQNEEIKFYQLVDSQYVEIKTSSCLPNLSAEFLIKFINRGLTESPLTIEADFVSQLDC